MEISGNDWGKLAATTTNNNNSLKVPLTSVLIQQHDTTIATSLPSTPFQDELGCRRVLSIEGSLDHRGIRVYQLMIN